MLNKETFIKVTERLNYLYKLSLEKKDWYTRGKPVIDEGASMEEIEKAESQMKKNLPEDLKSLYIFSKRISFHYEHGFLEWDLNGLIADYISFPEWIEGSLDSKSNDEESIAVTKKIGWSIDYFPFLNLGDGDLISIDGNTSKIVYFSHDGSNLHGKVLGKNLTEFLTLYAKVGFSLELIDQYAK